MTKVTILGAGYVGVPTGAHFARTHDVTIYDPDEAKIQLLKEVTFGDKKALYIHEDKLVDLLKENQRNLVITNDIKQALENPAIIFIAVGTPPNDKGRANLTYICQAAEQIAQHIKNDVIILNKSTVPPGTAYMVEKIIKKKCTRSDLNIQVGSCPEFLAEGTAIKDLRVPDRIIFGLDNDEALEKLKNFFLILHTKNSLVPMSTLSSEITKYASNAMLASRISFMNSLAMLCDEVGANIKEVQEGIGKDDRIGYKFLHAGMGYGGSCFPKDTNAIAEFGQLLGTPLNLIDATIKINNDVFAYFLQKILKDNNHQLEQQNFIVWGIGFKARTDDLRESKAVNLILNLIKRGAHIHIFDPIKGAVLNFENEYKHLKKQYTIYDSLYDCFENTGAVGLILGNECEKFRNPDIKYLNLLKKKYIYDGKNILQPTLVNELLNQGYHYRSVGRDVLSKSVDKDKLINFLYDSYMS